MIYSLIIFGSASACRVSKTARHPEPQAQNSKRAPSLWNVIDKSRKAITLHLFVSVNFLGYFTAIIIPRTRFVLRVDLYKAQPNLQISNSAFQKYCRLSGKFSLTSKLIVCGHFTSDLINLQS